MPDFGGVRGGVGIEFGALDDDAAMEPEREFSKVEIPFKEGFWIAFGNTSAVEKNAIRWIAGLPGAVAIDKDAAMEDHPSPMLAAVHPNESCVFPAEGVEQGAHIVIYAALPANLDVTLTASANLYLGSFLDGPDGTSQPIVDHIAVIVRPIVVVRAKLGAKDQSDRLWSRGVHRRKRSRAGTRHPRSRRVRESPPMV